MARVPPLLRTAVLILLAYFVSQLIYWRWVVPRLPHVHQVPLTWWLAVYSPFGLAAIAAGALLSSGRSIPLHACVAASVPAAARIIWSLVTGTSIGDDTGLENLIRWDPELWAIVLGGFAMMIVMFAGAITLGHTAVAARPHAG